MPARIVWRLILVCIVGGYVAAAGEGGKAPKSMYDFSAYPVKPEEAKELQGKLDAHTKIRLLPGDYTAAEPIVLRTNQVIYGLPGVRLPVVTVPGGTEHAAIYSASPRELRFLPGKPSSFNTFVRMGATNITSEGAKLSDNLFVGFLLTKIHIDNSRKGYLRNNRFIRMTVHCQWPQLVVKGNPARPDDSYGNVFLWFNFLTAHGDVSWIEHQKDLSLICTDSESWNWRKLGGAPLFHTGEMGTLRLFGCQGGNHLPRDRHTALIGTNARELHVIGVRVESHNLTSPNIRIGDANRRVLMLDNSRYSVNNQSSGSFRLSGFNRGQEGLEINGQRRDALSEEEAESLVRMVGNDNRTGAPWSRPRFASIPPVESDRRRKAASAPDSSAELQAVIDRDKLALLKPGTYYLGSPLILRSKNGLIGSGTGKTMLIAKDPEMDLIRIKPSVRGNQAFTLGQLTLIGGRVGLACRQSGTAVTRGYFSHITFRDMSRAGILMSRIYTWDNNMIDHLNFINCRNGVCQEVDPDYRGGDTPTMTFLDKNFWYRCRFIRCGTPLNLPAHRANNLNCYFECLFAESTERAVNLRNNTTTFFANCRFDRNAGDPMIQSNRKVYAVSCSFTPKGGGNSFFSCPVDLEGCTFETDAESNCQLLSSTGRGATLIFNCSAEGVDMTDVHKGIAVNSTLKQGNRNFNQAVVLFREEGGERYKYMAFDGGRYLESVYQPYAGIEELKDLDRSRFPSADWFDYSTIAEQAKAIREAGFAVCLGTAGDMDFINSIARARGVKEVLMDLFTDNPVYLAIMEGRFEFYYQMHERILQAAGGLIDFAHIGEDLGMQTRATINLVVFDKHFAPKLQKYFSMVHGYGARTMMHMCGTVHMFLPSLITLGLDVYDVVQPTTPENHIACLAEKFGDRLIFQGSMDVQRELAFGSVADVRREVKLRLDLFPKGGLILGPSHAVQPKSPIENTLAMYRTAGSLMEEIPQWVYDIEGEVGCKPNMSKLF